MAEALTITRTDETTHGAYRAELPGADRPAVLTWRALGPLRIADHTFVPPEMRGRQVAQQLVEALVADACEQGIELHVERRNSHGGLVDPPVLLHEGLGADEDAVPERARARQIHEALSRDENRVSTGGRHIRQQPTGQPLRDQIGAEAQFFSITSRRA